MNFPVQSTLLPPAPYLGAELTLLFYSAFASLPWPGFPLRSSLLPTIPLVLLARPTSWDTISELSTYTNPTMFFWLIQVSFPIESSQRSPSSVRLCLPGYCLRQSFI